jgi:hypothetical protein
MKPALLDMPSATYDNGSYKKRPQLTLKRSNAEELKARSVGKKYVAKFIAGQQIGLWTVLRDAGTRRSASGQARHYWQCRCACGLVKNVNQYNLASGRSKGCLVHKALTGRRFGKWTAVARMPRGSYRCRCRCGNVATFACGRLLRGELIRCGCCERRMNPHNKTGHRGVSFNKIGKYRAEIRVNYKLHFLGNHATACRSRLHPGCGKTSTRVRTQRRRPQCGAKTAPSSARTAIAIAANADGRGRPRLDSGYDRVMHGKAVEMTLTLLHSR